MKILMVNKFLYPNGGSETYIFRLGEELQKRGHEVQYFGMEHAGRVVGNRVECYTSDMDFHTGKLKKLFYPFKIIYSFEAKRRISVVLRDMDPDVVHLNNINFQLTPSVIDAVRVYEKKAGHRIRLVYTAHDYQWVCPNHMMRIPSTGRICFDCREGNFRACSKNRCIHGSGLKSLLGTIEAMFYHRRRTYALVDAIVCPSRFMKKQLDTDPLLADRTVFLQNFITEEGRRSESKAGNYVLYFGRLSEEKGTKTLLAACRALPQIPFVIAGTGPLQEEAAQVKNVEYKGFVQGEALRELIAGARFSVYPSEWYENCPFSVMESQMYGTPVLVSDLGGAPELVQAGSTGDIFRGGDVEELTTYIKDLWEHPEVCEAYRNNCKKINFDTIEEYCDKIVRKVYKE